MSWIDGFGNMPHDNRHTLVTELAESGAGDELAFHPASDHALRVNLLEAPDADGVAHSRGGGGGGAGAAHGVLLSPRLTEVQTTVDGGPLTFQ